jgi:hypothetical protein
MMVEQEMIQESYAEVMMANNVTVEILSPTPDSKFREIVFDGCGKSNMVGIVGEQYKQG